MKLAMLQPMAFQLRMLSRAELRGMMLMAVLITIVLDLLR
jgi:hypothetical protein